MTLPDRQAPPVRRPGCVSFGFSTVASGAILAVLVPPEAIAVDKERLTVQDLFPAAEALFQPRVRRGRRRLRVFTWLLLVATALLVSQLLRRWFRHDR